MQPITINVHGNLIVTPPSSGTLLASNIERIADPVTTSRAANAFGPIKILADGTHLHADSDRTDHVALLYDDGWMVHVITLSDDRDAFDNQANAIKACKSLRALGYDDWQLAPREVWDRHVINVEFFDPAVDPKLYPGVRSGWHHTSTDCVWTKDKKTGVASAAWFVYSGGGNVNGDLRSGDGFGFAARRVGQ